MRLNQFIALSTGVSRRQADSLIQAGRVHINGKPAQYGQPFSATDTITLDGRVLEAPQQTTTIILNKPVGYVCSRDGQGARTIYDLLPAELHTLKPVGRLDKDSSGLLLLTNDGKLANELTHPRYAKTKRYTVRLDKHLEDADCIHISQAGVNLDDGPSQLELQPLGDNGKKWEVVMQEGRNRQIRRTFAALGYTVTELHRTEFGTYELGDMNPGQYRNTF